ncbi:MAG: MarC family protein, partial [Mycobacterium sp.]
MMLDTTLYLTVFITLFVIMDPPGVIPVFLSLVGRKSREDRNRAAWQAPAVSLAVISVFAIGGQAILNYLHIGIPALQGAGGLLLLLIALELLTGK